MQDTQVYQPPEKSIFLDLLNSDSLIQNYEHHLRGEKLQVHRKRDEKTGKELITEDWVQVQKPKMHEAGINSVMGMLFTMCDKSLSMTSLTPEQIDMLVKQNCDAWLDFLCINAQEFGLNTPSKIDEVYRPARNIIITKLNSTVNGMMIDALSKTTQVSEQHVINPQDPNPQQPSGFLGKIGLKI